MDSFQIIITSRAQSDLSECVSFALNVSKEAAFKLADDIYSAIESLSLYPERYPVFEMPKSSPYLVRKLVINKRYVALYCIEENKVVVHRFLDSRRDFDYLVS